MRSMKINGVGLRISFMQTILLDRSSFFDKLELAWDHSRPTFVPEYSKVEPFHTLLKKNNTQVQAPREQPNPFHDMSQSVRNQSVDPRFFVTTNLGAKLRRLRIPNRIARAMTQGKCIPVHPKQRSPDNQRCLSWHLKGICYDNCKKRYNHSPLSDAAKEEMHEYTKAMVLWRSGRHQPEHRVVAEPVSSLLTLLPSSSTPCPLVQSNIVLMSCKLPPAEETSIWPQVSVPVPSNPASSPLLNPYTHVPTTAELGKSSRSVLPPVLPISCCTDSLVDHPEAINWNIRSELSPTAKPFVMPSMVRPIAIPIKCMRCQCHKMSVR